MSLFFSPFPLSFSVRQSNLFSVDSCAPLCSLFLTKLFLSRQAAGVFSPRWLSRRWGNRLLVVLFTVKIHVCRFSCHKEDTVVNVSQHRAVVFCVGGLHWLFLHLSGETWILLYYWNNITEGEYNVMLWKVIFLVYLNVEAKFNHGCPNVFIAKFNWELVGHVLKVI